MYNIDENYYHLYYTFFFCQNPLILRRHLNIRHPGQEPPFDSPRSGTDHSIHELQYYGKSSTVGHHTVARLFGVSNVWTRNRQRALAHAILRIFSYPPQRQRPSVVAAAVRVRFVVCCGADTVCGSVRRRPFSRRVEGAVFFFPSLLISSFSACVIVFIFFLDCRNYFIVCQFSAVKIFMSVAGQNGIVFSGAEEQTYLIITRLDRVPAVFVGRVISMLDISS